MRFDDGTAACFGRNNERQIGNAMQMSDATQVTSVDTITGVAELAAGRHFNCARLDDGTVWCWGYNDEGQLGRDSTLESSVAPTQVVGLTDTTQIAAGAHHACAIDSSAQVWCWGSASSGQLGNGGDGTRANRPIRVPELDGAVELGTGRAHTCARRSDGSIRCVGSRQSGQLGDGQPVLDEGVGLSSISCERYR